MDTGEDRLGRLVAAVLDGQRVDWSTADSSVDVGQRPLVRHLKVIDAVAGVHRGPDHWGHLRLDERIGAGAFGDVYRAWDTRLDREVALKLLLADGPSEGQDTSSIIREGRLLARVDHPNVVTIHGAEQIGRDIGLWMELVRGRTLEQLVAEEGRLDSAEAARIGIDLCSAVAAVHAAGLIHRDIKAHNVMRSDDGRVVLMDFGTGRELTERASSDLTGTPLYAAPEVLEGRPATVQSDIYSLGVLLFYILTGSYPVRGPQLADIRRAHVAGTHVRLRAARPDLSPALALAIDRAIDPSPEARYQSAAMFAAALRSAACSRARRWPLLAAVAATALVVAGLAWRDVRASPPRGPSGAPRIAVLPFDDRDARQDGGEFADGLAREIQRTLAGIEGLALRSTGSSFVFRDRPRDLQEIASRLGVDYVLEGSVSRANDTLQIDARFVRASDEAALWSRRFSRPVRRLPEVLDDISLAIVNEMRVTLGRGQRRYDLDPDLYYTYLRARAAHGRRGPANSTRAAELFEQVAAGAPGYAPAWAGLASSLAQLSRPSTGEAIVPLDPRLRPAAMRALQLDPLLPEAHAALANVYASERDWVSARMSFLKAISLDPTMTEAHSDLVLGVLMPVGDLSEALLQLEAARVADPLSLDVARTQAHVFVEAGQYDRAIGNCLWIKRHDSSFPYVDLWFGRALYLSGRFDEARVVLEKAAPQSGYMGYLLAVSGRRDDAEALAAANPTAWSHNMLIFAGLGDRDRAYEALVRTADVNWWRASTWMRRPEMALVQGDARLPALRRALRLPD